MKRALASIFSISLILSLVSFAYAAQTSYIAHLSGDQEVPPADTQGKGHAAFQLNETGNELSYKIVVENVENITMSHIHIAPAGQNGGVVVWLYPDTPSPVLIPGTFNGVLAEGVITESELTGELEGRPLSDLLGIIETGNAYVNVHTEQYPGGEIRGQIMTAPSSMFKVMIENIAEVPEYSASGVFNIPEGAEGPGILTPGSTYTFSFGATPGSKLSFASMFAQSNDLFYAPGEAGISLFDADGMPVSGDVTSQVMLWDAGTEVNQEPGIGPDQAPRQTGPDTGADENGVVQPITDVNDGYTYPDTADSISVIITPGVDNEFEVSIQNISVAPQFSSSGVANTPTGAAEPGILFPDNSYVFNVKATPGSKLSFASMYAQSNDLFYAPGEAGISLFDADGMPVSGDVTSQVMLWDAGTEVNQEPGIGPDQAPRQTGPDTGADENGVVQPIADVNDGYTYPDTAGSLSVMVTPVSDTEFEITIMNISADPTFIISPLAWVVHNEDSPLFMSGQPDYGAGLERIAEDGGPSMLAAYLEERSGYPVVLSPGVWVVHSEDAPLFTSGQPDYGNGLERIAEDGNTSTLAAYLEERSGYLLLLSPGAWAVSMDKAPIFTAGQPDYGEGLEGIAEDGNPSMLGMALASKVGIYSSGIFNTPVGAETPSPIGPGGKFEFQLDAITGTKLSFATMYAQSNDLFYSPGEAGIMLFNPYGGTVSGDVTSQIMLWDAGTEVNQRPGVGPDQAPRQAGPNTGADENGVVQLVNDGYSYPDVMDSIRVTITPVMPEKDYTNVFYMPLSAGLNMVSLPLETQQSHTARSFAEVIGATVVIGYDTSAGMFIAYIPGMEGDGFAINGGQGYIINRLTDGVVAFAGAAWTNEPPVLAAPPLMERSTAWAFAVSGKLQTDSMDDQQIYTAAVKNLQTGTVVTDKVAGNGSFAAVFADLNRNPVIETGNMLEITIIDESGQVVSGPVVRQIGSGDIRMAFTEIIMKLGRIVPGKTVLLQNYPNPFNPDTWIPYQLAKPAHVTVRIHDLSGKLVRLLDLGHRNAGTYSQKQEAVYWDGRNDRGEEAASGIYFYTITAGEFSATRKMTVRK